MACFGWHATSKLWFSGDSAITPEGALLRPDVDGVIWHNGLGYRMGTADWEGESFAMGRPTWQPEQALRWDVERGLFLEPGDQDHSEAMRELFLSLQLTLIETLGGPEGLLVLGAMFSFAAAPEFFEREKWFPGLWIHGERGSGKTMLARWMMRVWGFNLEGGVNLPNCTKVGMQLASQQYSNLPLWFEEYQSTLDQAKVEMVKSLYNREPLLKKEFGEQRRRIVSNAVITGEATAADSAIRQRFPHVQVSDKRRKGNTQEWFQSNEHVFFTLGRFALRNRTEFVKEFYRAWRAWNAEPLLRVADERSKQVHGVSWAGFVAFNEILGKATPPKELDNLKTWLMGHTIQAVRDVKSDVKVNIFWQLLIDAFKLGVFGFGSEVRRFFIATKKLSDFPPRRNDPGAVGRSTMVEAMGGMAALL